MDNVKWPKLLFLKRFACIRIPCQHWYEVLKPQKNFNLPLDTTIIGGRMANLQVRE